MNKSNIKNLRFELIDSTLKGSKEVQAIFNYQGENYKYLIFITEGERVNYIKEAKRKFNKDLASGKVIKTLQATGKTKTRFWAITAITGISTVAVTFAALFIYKAVTEIKPVVTHSIFFESNGGTHVDTIKVDNGKTITPPEEPTKDDYDFTGWYVNPDFTGSAFTFADPIKNDITLYANWTNTSDYVTITFDAGENNQIEGIRSQVRKHRIKKGMTFISAWEELKFLGGNKKDEDFLYWTYNDLPINNDFVIEDNIRLNAVYKPVSNDYLTVTARIDNVSLMLSTNNDLKFSRDGNLWENATKNAVLIEHAGEQVYVKREKETALAIDQSIPIFSAEEPHSVSGPIDCLYNRKTTGLPEESFWYCFSSSQGLVSVNNLNLGNFELTKNCCYQMFYSCNSLIAAPELPTITLAERCYSSMFYGCSSLVIAPELPATTLAPSCYSMMFYGCISLTTPPELLAENLSDGCYYGMFSSCRSLVNAPDLPATTLADQCYSDMFRNCKSLEHAPKLPAKVLTESCYETMFYECPSLRVAPEFSPTTLAARCCYQMFVSCRSLITAPSLPATILADECYGYMFRDCMSLKVYENDESGTLIFKCPSTIGVTSMFQGVGGDFTSGTPTVGNSYYFK